MLSYLLSHFYQISYIVIETDLKHWKPTDQEKNTREKTATTTEKEKKNKKVMAEQKETVTKISCFLCSHSISRPD